MRIAFFSWESLFSVAVGGVANHVSELAAALHRQGHEVHVFVRKADGQKDYSLHEGVVYHTIPIDINPDFVTEMGNMGNSLVWHLKEYERRTGQVFDIVHGHDWMCAKGLVQAKNDLGKIVVMTIHSTEFGRSGNVNHKGPTERIRLIEAEGLFVADKVIAVSGPLAQEVQDQYQVPEWKLSVVHNGIRCQRFDVPNNVEAVRSRYGIGPMDPTILFTGRLSWQKGPDLLLEAIPFVLRHRKDAKFLFAGDGHMRKDLERRVRQLGLDYAVKFLGSMEGVRLIELFKSSDAVCVPSRNEPFGIVILEAWAAGKPVIATINGGPREVVTHKKNGLHVFDNSGSIAWGICTMFDNFEAAHGMGAEGRKLAETSYTWDTLAEQTLEVYKKILTERGVYQENSKESIPPLHVPEMEARAKPRSKRTVKKLTKKSLFEVSSFGA
jgi:glycosyltransferase involved in cell wall biosynthesis